MKPELTLERFFEVFVPGVLIAIGTWYFHRPFLQIYFPVIAADHSLLDGISGNIGSKAFAFSVLVLALGVICNHFSDLALVGLIEESYASDKTRRWSRRVFKWMLKPVVFISAPDPRIHAIRRYQSSPRAPIFQCMISNWCMMDGAALHSPNSAIIAHQHVLARLRVLSPESRRMVAELYSPVSVAASLFVASALLVPIGVLSFLSRMIVVNRTQVQPLLVTIVLVSGAYLLAIIMGVSLRRRFRHFCAQVLTLGLHCFLENQGIMKKGQRRAGGEEINE